MIFKSKKFYFQIIFKPRSISDQKTNFFDLKYDILLMICERLDATDLLSMIEASEQLSAVIERAWMRKNGQKWVVFLPDACGIRKIGETSEEITLDSSESGQKFVRYFGPLMAKISIEYNRPFEMDRTMFQLINSYCSESLIHLHIEQFALFEEFKAPFNKLESISLKGDFSSSVIPPLKFSEMSPSLRSIKWNVVNTITLHLDDEKLPHLEEIDGNIISKQAENTFKHLIRTHPHIRVLNLDVYRRNFLETVANEMSSFEKLENLEQFRIKLGQQQVTFNFSFNSNSTKSFNLTGDTIENLIATNTFGDLVEFDAWSLFNRYGKETIQFLPIHKNSLKILRLQPKVGNDDILLLANAEMNFIELELHLYFGIEVDSLIQLLEKSKSLRHVILHMSDANGVDYFFTKYEEFHEKLPRDWRVEQIYVNRASYYQLDREETVEEEDEF